MKPLFFVGASGLAIFYLATPALAQKKDNSPETPPVTMTLRVPPRPVPAQAIALQNAGDAAMRSGNMKAAANAYVQAARFAPGEPLFRMFAGIALIESGQRERAIGLFREATRLAEDDLIAALLLQGALAEQPQTAAEAQGIFLEATRRYTRPGKSGLDSSGSVTRLTLAAARHPASAPLRLLLGDAYQISEQYDKADQQYLLAVQLAPRWAKPYVNLGVSRLAQGKTDLAIKTFALALNFDPSNTQAQLGKADAQLRSGRNEEAVLSYRVLENDKSLPVQVQAATGMGQAFANSGKIPEAVRSLKKAQTLAPDDPVPVFTLGQVETQVGNHMAAADAYQTALRVTKAGGLFASPSILYRALAEAQLAAKKPAEAIETLRRAIREEPESKSLWFRLIAQACFQKGEPKEGEQALRDALNSAGDLYPQDTMNAIAAQNGTLEHVKAAYKADTVAADSDARGIVTENTISMTKAAGGTGRAKAQALTGLAHIARYEGDVKEEIRLRQEAAEEGKSATYWFLLGEAYDNRKHDGQSARMCYQKALSLGGLSEAASTFAQARLKVLIAPSR